MKDDIVDLGEEVYLTLMREKIQNDAASLGMTDEQRDTFLDQIDAIINFDHSSIEAVHAIVVQYDGAHEWYINGVANLIAEEAEALDAVTEGTENEVVELEEDVE